MNVEDGGGCGGESSGAPSAAPHGRLPGGADTAVPVSHLLYLHGFRSSPRSAKARRMTEWVHTHRPDLRWWCPQLPPSPAEALGLLERGIAGWPLGATAVIGSSLGGFYASVLAERHAALRAVLLNPAVDPARDLARHIGRTTAWHDDEPFWFRAEFIGELDAMTPAAITGTGRYFSVIASGDDVLDAREMQARYAGCPGLAIEGGDHALSDFDAALAALLRALQLA